MWPGRQLRLPQREKPSVVRLPPVTPARRSAASNASAEDKTDRRVRRTKRQLREALTTLLLKKKFSEITVRELSELADVNRGTFYTHYRDTEDLLEQLESGFLNELRRIDASIQRQDWERGAYSYLEELLRLCRDNADIYLALVCRKRRPRLCRPSRLGAQAAVSAWLRRPCVPGRAARTGALLRLHRGRSPVRGHRVAQRRDEGDPGPTSQDQRRLHPARR